MVIPAWRVEIEVRRGQGPGEHRICRGPLFEACDSYFKAFGPKDPII